MAIRLNTAAVLAAAEQIDTINKKIRDEQDDLDRMLRTLQQNWDGGGAASCANKYEYIRRKFSDSRFSVVNGVVSFMRVQVGEGYEMTEQIISKAASAFK